MGVSVAGSRVGLAVASVVRVALGVPTETHPEPHQIGVEQFLSMLRFNKREELAELSHDLGKKRNAARKIETSYNLKNTSVES